MVTILDPLAIDSAFLFERTHAMFLGANLIVKNGQDNTFAYGFLRSLLRLTKNFCCCRIVVLLTAETFKATDQGSINYISSILNAIGIPVYSRPEEALVTVCRSILPFIRGLISENMAPLQFVCEDFSVIRTHSDRESPYLLNGDKVREDYGVDPIHIPTFLALTTGPRHSRFTVRQAQRLIQTYGDFREIYRDLSDNDILATKLHDFRQEVLDRYRHYYVTPDRPEFRGMKKLSTGTPTIERLHTMRILKELGCHSLARLL